MAVPFPFYHEPIARNELSWCPLCPQGIHQSLDNQWFAVLGLMLTNSWPTLVHRRPCLVTECRYYTISVSNAIVHLNDNHEFPFRRIAWYLRRMFSEDELRVPPLRLRAFETRPGHVAYFDYDSIDHEAVPEAKKYWEYPDHRSGPPNYMNGDLYAVSATPISVDDFLKVSQIDWDTDTIKIALLD